MPKKHKTGMSRAGSTLGRALRNRAKKKKQGPVRRAPGVDAPRNTHLETAKEAETQHRKLGVATGAAKSSVTEYASSLDAFLAHAVMAERDFETERTKNMTVVDAGGGLAPLRSSAGGGGGGSQAQAPGAPPAAPPAPVCLLYTSPSPRD